MIEPLFAQFTPPVEIAAWLACLAFCVMMFNQGAKAYGILTGKKQQISPQPLMVQEAERFMTKEVCDRNHAEAERAVRTAMVEVAKLQDQLEKDRREASISRKSVYAEINRTTDETRKHMEDVRRELSEQIHAMPDRVVMLLRNTGVIK
jgi:hypothetical protein